MNDKLSILKRRIGGPDFEVQIVRWSGVLISLASVYLMAVVLPRAARNRAELILSILGAASMFLTLLIGLILSIQIHRTRSAGKRRGHSSEHFSYAACLALAIGFAWMCPTLGFASALELRVGVMLLCSTCGAVLTLGMLITLVRAPKV
jgi:hypothetical protein